MLVKVYTVYDLKGENFLAPFCRLTKGLALRDFSDLVNDTSSMFGKYPGDYALFELGTFDDSKATYDLYVAPIHLGYGNEYVITKNDPHVGMRIDSSQKVEQLTS